MGISGGPDVIQDGLVLALDAGDKNSYPGSGATWTDIIQSRAFTLFNTPIYSSNNGGYLSFTPASSQYAQATSLPSSLSISKKSRSDVQ